MNIMGMGWQEMMIILVGALLIFGPDRLPEVAGQIGKFVRDLRKMTTDLTGEFERTAGVGDIKKAVQQELSGVKSTVNSATKGVNSTFASASGAVSSSKSATGSKTPATPSVKASGSSSAKTTAKAVSSTSAKEIKPAPKPVASKKDPLADVSFFDEVAGSNGGTPAPGTMPASSSANGHDSSAPVAIPIDALGRARQRRIAAGYNRHST